MKNLTLFLLIMTEISMSLSAQPISEDFPFESQFLQVGNARLHYVESGEGDPILFLHGVPMSAYAWRNVIPHLSDSARCIAIDFMGFGKSDKPDIDYSFDDQLGYVSQFIEQMNLNQLTLVMTDIGGIIGTRYAMNNPERIKALVFMENPLSDAETFHKNGGMMQRMMFWMSGKDKMGHKMIVKRNMFIKMMPMLIKRKLSPVEKERYAEPFLETEARKAMFTPPNSFPRKGKHAQAGDMADYLNQNAAQLQVSNLPKLLLYAKPGMLINKKVLKWAEEHLPNLDTQYLGKAKHLMEEELPHEIGTAIKNWHAKQEMLHASGLRDQ